MTDYVTRQVGNTVIQELPTSAPPTNFLLTPLDFRKRFTLTEKQSIYSAATSNPLIRCFLDDVTSAGIIDLTDPYTINDVQYIEAQGLIATGRAAQILTP
jgi:hypothetical protein